jgi:hypothetical protein
MALGSKKLKTTVLEREEHLHLRQQTEVVKGQSDHQNWRNAYWMTLQKILELAHGESQLQNVYSRHSVAHLPLAIALSLPSSEGTGSAPIGLSSWKRVLTMSPTAMWPRSDFLSLVLFKDKADFTRDGTVNFHSLHTWADVNPRNILESRHQQRFSLNVWAGILGDQAQAGRNIVS